MNLSRLRDVRKSRGLTQRELAARLHTEQPRIAKIENGFSVPKRTAEKIAAVLLCGVSDLQTASEPTVILKLSELPPELLQRLTK